MIDHDAHTPVTQAPLAPARGGVLGTRAAAAWWARRWARLRARPVGPFVVPGAIVFVVTALVVLATYLNHPQVEIYPDSNGYIAVAHGIRDRGAFVDALRMPGYPSLMALVFALAHGENFALLSAVQGALFALAAVEVYALTALIARRAWIAAIVGLLLGTNLYAIKYVKPIVSDGLALWLVVTLSLATVVCVRWPRARHLWLVAGCLLALFMTRPEWAYAPALVFAYLLVVAARQGKLRRLWPHALGATLALYLLLGAFVYQNATRNGYAGITWIQNVNLLGKVMQFGMQDEAPPQYAAVARTVDAYLARGGSGPWRLVDATPALNAHHGALAGAFGLAVISTHPLEFAARESLVVFTSTSFNYTADDFQTISAIQPNGPFGAMLLALRALSAGVYWTYELFLATVAQWVVRAIRRRGQHGDELGPLAPLGAVLLLGLYALGITTLAAYGDYARIHSSFNPLLLVAVWTTALTLGARLWRARAPAASAPTGAGR
ncbi:MAG TPA: hypothetical protein VGN32_16530 [Ktedonobacterales bacterium]|nr:hypothetical protein [Ktedonobacterales bacterium]